jgi:hypothetical protein
VRKITSISGIRAIFPLSQILRQGIIRHLKSHVGNSGRNITEERLALVILDKSSRLLRDEVGGIVVSLEAEKGFWVAGILIGAEPILGGKRGIVKGDLPIVVPKIGRKEVVGHCLAVVSEPTIKSLFEGLPGRIGTTESPFPKAACGITRSLEEFWEGEFL